MTNYELEYFPVRGRGEAIRLLLSDSGLTYKEINVLSPDPSAWANKFKPRMPFGQCPMFRDGDFELVQSNAILRYLGRKHGLVGNSNEDLSKADMVNDSVEDLRSEYVRFIYQNYDAGKEEFVKKLPEKLKPFEKFLANGKSTFVLDKITFVDYNLFDLLDILSVLSPGCLKEFPVLAKYFQTIADRPGIKERRSSEACKKMQINGNGKQ
uniref:glutathione transferase n=1 Tax=Laternula elliptica TaxID=228457 RepID=A8D2H2_LATEL|nr:pi class glutathione S-transferase [Laternula elliptica]